MARAKAKYTIEAEDKTGRAFASVKGRVEKTRGAFQGLGSAVAGIAAGAGFAGLIKSSLDAADQIQKLSLQGLGATEFLSEMGHVAELSGVQFKTFTTGMRTMVSQIGEAQRTGKGMTDQLEAIGLSIDTLAAMKPEDQFLTIAEAMSKMTDQTQQTTIAQKLFGGRASELLRIINQGTGAIEGMRTEARDLGLSLSQDMVNSAADANDAITRLTGAFRGVGVALAADFAGPLSGAADILRGTLVPALGFVMDLIQRLGGMLGGIAAALSNLFQGNFVEAFRAITSASDDFLGGVAGDFRDRVSQGGKVLSKVGKEQGGEKTGDKLDEQTKVLQEINRNLRNQVAVAG